MMIGETIFAGTSVLTDWFSREADNIFVLAEEIDQSAFGDAEPPPVELTIQLRHKNNDETGDGTAVGTSITLDGSSPTFKSTTVTGLKEQLRFELTCTALGWMHFRVLRPIWFDTARP